MNKERELLNWSKAEHCESEDKREERNDGECKKSKESTHKTWYFHVKHPIWYPEYNNKAKDKNISDVITYQ